MAIRTKGKEEFEKEKDVIKTLINLLQHKNNAIVSMVNCLLFSLITRDKFHKEAQRLNLESN